MTDRVTLTQPCYMKVQGQWMIVEGQSQIDVASAASFSPSMISNVQLGTGTLLNGVHNNPVSNFGHR
jgi:hypothetical protein